MPSPENPKREVYLPENVIADRVATFGIGHMTKEVSISFDEIPETERVEVIDTYTACVNDIELLMTTLNDLFSQQQTDGKGKEVFKDIYSGVSMALNKTANQILYHATENPRDSLTAFDELKMILETVNNSLISPKIAMKKEYEKSSRYELALPESVEGFNVSSFDALFSKEHIAFNITSHPYYQDTEKTIKSGIRLDYGPLYKETPEGIDQTKTEWVTSVDISGYYIDKIMNKYSPRGHHFTKMFEHKIHLILTGLAKAMERHFDESEK